MKIDKAECSVSVFRILIIYFYNWKRESIKSLRKFPLETKEISFEKWNTSLAWLCLNYEFNSFKQSNWLSSEESRWWYMPWLWEMKEGHYEQKNARTIGASKGVIGWDSRKSSDFLMSA